MNKEIDTIQEKLTELRNLMLDKSGEYDTLVQSLIQLISVGIDMGTTIPNDVLMNCIKESLERSEIINRKYFND